MKVDLNRVVYDFDSKKLQPGVQDLSDKLAKNLIKRGAAVVVLSDAEFKKLKDA